MQFDPAELAPELRYKLLIGGIVPRPIAFVSTRSALGAPNLAPFSFFNAIGSKPMLLQFCPANRSDGSPKDTLANALLPEDGGTGEFVVNLVPHAIGRQMAATAEDLAPGEDEFAFSGLTAAPSVRVAAPRLAESPLSYECRTRQVLRFAPGEPGGANLVIGEIVYVHLRDGIADERLRLDPDALDLIGRMGGRSYARTRERFDLPFGRSALDEVDG